MPDDDANPNGESDPPDSSDAGADASEASEASDRSSNADAEPGDGSGEGLPVPRQMQGAGAAPMPQAQAEFTPHKPIATTSLVVLLLVLHVVLDDATRLDLTVWQPALHAGEYWRLLTSCFVHADWMHVGVNSLVLLQLGRILEGLLGWKRLLVLFLTSGLAGSAVSALATDNPALGASGALFGMVGVLALLLRLMHGSWGAVARLPGMSVNIVLLVGINLLPLFGVPIGVAAHLGGLAGGLVFTGVQYVRPEVTNRTRVRAIRATIALAVLAAVCVASALPMPWQSDTSSDGLYGYYLYRAEKAWQAGEPDAALGLVDRLGPPDRLSRDLRLGRLNLLLRMRRVSGDAMGTELAALRSQYPDDPLMLANVGLAHLQRGEYRVAADTLARAEAAGATDWEIGWERCRALELLHRGTNDPASRRKLRDAWQHLLDHHPELPPERADEARARIAELDAWLAQSESR